MSVMIPFFEEQVFFLTGVTGFVGKVLLHKLLTSCPNIGKDCIYVLVRGKKNMSPQDRFDQDVFNKSPIFANMGHHRDKIKVVEGDIAKNKLGLSSEHYSEICERVNIIIHMAATVSFNEKLLIALDLNTFGPLQVLTMGSLCKNLKSITFTSTCYVNSNIVAKKAEQIGEKIYPFAYDPNDLLKEISKLTTEAVEIFTSRIINGFPNTYTFTKCLAEHMLYQEKGSIPIAIVRPAIIGPALEYPVLGWVDSYIGPTGLALASGLGALRIMEGYGPNLCDIVPVDIVVNALLCVAYNTCINPPKKEVLPIYHCATSKQNPCCWRRYVDISCGFWGRNPPKKGTTKFWGGPWTLFVPQNTVSTFSRTFLHQTPAALGDFTRLLKGQSPNFVKQVNTLHGIADSLAYFTSHEWLFMTQNLLNLNQALSPEDREVFDLDVTPQRFTWESYVIVSCRGTRKYLLKEEGPPAEHIPTFYPNSTTIFKRSKL